jgi:hypothetical protein
VLAWVARLWATTPKTVAEAAALFDAPADIDPLLCIVGREYLPYLAANSRAVAAGSPWVEHDASGVRWRVPASPYRANCLDDLQRSFGALPEADRSAASVRIGPGCELLDAEPGAALVTRRRQGRIVNRRWS